MVGAAVSAVMVDVEGWWSHDNLVAFLVMVANVILSAAANILFRGEFRGGSGEFYSGRNSSGGGDVRFDGAHVGDDWWGRWLCSWH